MHKKASFSSHYYESNAKDHSFTELISTIKDKVNEPQMQWVYYEGKLQAYLNIFVGELKSIGKNKREVLVNILTDQGQLTFKAPLLKGGQRIKIPEEILPKVIEAFESSKHAVLSVSGYKTQLNLEQFRYMLDKAKKKHPLSRFKSAMIFDL